MSSNPQGIRNYSKMNDVDKSYLVKLLGTIFMAFVTGIVTGERYDALNPPGYTGISNSSLGFLIWFVTTMVLTFYIRNKFNLADMTDFRIFRHGVAIGFLSFIFFWVVIFQFYLPPIQGQ